MELGCQTSTTALAIGNGERRSLLAAHTLPFRPAMILRPEAMLQRFVNGSNGSDPDLLAESDRPLHLNEHHAVNCGVTSMPPVR